MSAGAAVQLTKPVSQIATATATFAASAAAGTTVMASITVIRGQTPAAQLQQVPVTEFWYITSIYLPAGVSPSAVNGILITYVNNIAQPLAPMESEVQQTIYNKLRLSADQWIQLQPGISWYQQIQSTVANGTSATTVTFSMVLLRVPVALAK